MNVEEIDVTMDRAGFDAMVERAGGRRTVPQIFIDGRQRPEYVPWTDVEQVDFDRPPAMFPSLRGR